MLFRSYQVRCQFRCELFSKLCILKSMKWIQFESMLCLLEEGIRTWCSWAPNQVGRKGGIWQEGGCFSGIHTPVTCRRCGHARCMAHLRHVNDREGKCKVKQIDRVVVWFPMFMFPSGGWYVDLVSTILLLGCHGDTRPYTPSLPVSPVWQGVNQRGAGKYPIEG